MKKTRFALLHSAIALLLCLSMLAGTTFAWFTDQETSGNNIIQAGNLDAAMYWNKDLTGSWISIDDQNQIFDYDKWEPGYTEVRYVKIANEGNLAFKYALSILPLGAVGILADVIDVYYFEEPTTAISGRADLDGVAPVGTLAQAIAGAFDTDGKLGAGEDIVVGIALKMREEADNRYMGKSIGDSFSIRLVATQLANEDDSFGKDYDDGATFPDAPVNEGVTAPVENENNQVKNDVALNGENASATVLAGTKLEDGATSLTLTVTELNESNANITLGENEEKKSIDVHIDGIAPTNDKPIVISLGAIAPIGQNSGNFKLYHVENAQSVEMTRVASPSELVAHNTFYYDPATGEVTVAMATFSEVALVADTENAWEGKFDYTWYDASKTELTIANADQLAAFGAIVGGMGGQTQDSFAGKTVKLVADINLGDDEKHNKENLIFYPIGYYNSEGTYERTNTAITSGLRNFEGTFDGNGHTIKNFYQNTWEMKGDHNWYSPEEQYYRDGMGLFGKVYGGTVKNLTVDNFSSDGEIATTGVIAAYADGATFENIAITNCNPRVYNIGNGGIVGCVGWYAEEANLKTTFTNITVDNSNKISALWGSYDVACGGIVGQYYPTSGQTSAGTPKNAGIDLVNCHVSAQMDVYNDVCGNYQYYAYRYAGMMIGSIRENATTDDGKTIPDMTGISATGCTVNYGDWNDYYYCEFEKNGHPSYSGPDDYKFSRVPHSELNFTDSNGNGVVDANERASVTGCKHNHTDAENNKAIYLPFHQLFTGYGWGVNSIGLEKYSGIVTNLDITEGDQEASVEKFEDAGYTPKDYRPGETITIGDLFKVKGDAVINGNSVYVSVSPITEGDNVSATFAPNEEDWTKSTITFALDSTGTAKVTITDYIFCTPTTIYLNEEEAVGKFTANTVDAQSAYTQITLGDLFGIKNGATIGNVTATVTDPNGNKATVTGTSSDWATKTIDLVKEGTWTVSVVDDDKYCAATETTFTVNKVDKFTKKFDKDFLYRVGNANTVAWTSLFADLSDRIAPQNLSVTVGNVKGDAAGTFTNGAIEFTGTGVVTVIISADGANSVELMLEVVNATNVAENGKIGNYNTTSVLLGNTSISTLYLNGGATLYGNGFTIDCTNSPTSGTGNVSGNYIIGLDGANLDNVKVIGKVYTEYGAMASSNYNRALIISTGNSTITNCYLSNTASPVRINSGSLTITGSTLKGGNFANIDVRSGHLTLDNVITINQALGNDKADDNSTVIGLGIVVYYEMVNTSATSITVKNGLKQYNAISSDDEFSNEYANQFVTGMFDSSNSSLQYTNGNTKWVNTGIILMTGGINVTGAGNKTDVSFMGATGAVYTTIPTAASVKETPVEYATLGQGVLIPSASFDHDNEVKGNYIPKEADKNDYCYFDGEQILISMDQGDTFQYDPFILNATKLGNALNYTVKLNGTTVASGSKISFNTAGEYTITYTYEDTYNYRLDSDGNLESFTVTYTKTEIVNVAIVEPEAEHAKFTFATNSTGTEEILYNNNTYISAKGITADGTSWGKITVGDKTIFYPIVTANVNRNTTNKECQVFYYVFKNVISITDANGTVYSHDNQTGTDGKMPGNLKVIKGNELKVENNVFTNYNDSNLSRTGGKIFCYSSSSQEDTPEAFNGALAYKSPSGLSYNGSRNYDAAVIVQYQFTDSNNMTYYYYVGYKISNPSNGSSGDGEDETCLTAGTLITLADGTQTAVENLKVGDMILVFNHVSGQYEAMPLIFNTHADDIEAREYDVLNLEFSNGKNIKVVSSHGFFDMTLNQYVYISDENYNEYVGHEFYALADDGMTGEKATLTNAFVATEVTRIFCPVTYFHMNSFANGFLNTPNIPGDITGLVNYFEYDEDLKYNEEKMAADIEKYGLYTYDDFSEYISEDAYNSSPSVYLKVAVGKGMITYEQIIDVINYLLSGSLID